MPVHLAYTFYITTQAISMIVKHISMMSKIKVAHANRAELMDTFVYVHILHQEVRRKVETSILPVEKDTTCMHISALHSIGGS